MDEIWTEDWHPNSEHFPKNPDSKAVLRRPPARFSGFYDFIRGEPTGSKKDREYLSNACTDFNEIWTDDSDPEYASFKKNPKSKACSSPILAQIFVQKLSVQLGQFGVTCVVNIFPTSSREVLKILSPLPHAILSGSKQTRSQKLALDRRYSRCAVGGHEILGTKFKIFWHFSSQLTREISFQRFFYKFSNFDRLLGIKLCVF